MATTTKIFALNLGSSRAGLLDLRAQLLNADATTHGSPISSAFTDAGAGAYLATLTLATTFTGAVKFYNIANTFTPIILSLNATDVAPSSSISLDTVVGYLVVRDASGNPIAGATINYRMNTPPTGTASAWSDEPQAVNSDDTGLATITLVVGATYCVWFGDGAAVTIAPDGSTDPFPIPEVVGQ